MPTTGSYLHWIKVSHAVPQIGFFASIGLGLTVLCLNFCGAQKNFRSYKYIVNIFTILGMIFVVSEILFIRRLHIFLRGYNVAISYTVHLSVLDNFRITAPTIILFTPNLIIILLPLFNPQISIPSGTLSL
ncbi:Protein CBG17932 [Caenorhabditis briggsae]|uniref:Protein CBG17932 n=1 Tax=Caenorhabditis briggsae TaxID=6238 RepID=A8XS48_CAEBR|nr:Protein CBG17932 [Caenorhabditis briggsae]CAP35467.2 Protein CBG17932 [Caenorhabditis briggsae]